MRPPYVTLLIIRLGREMKINVNEGTISFAAGIIEPNLDRTAFLKTPIGGAAKQMLVNAGYINYDISPEPDLTGSVVFKDDHLRKVFLLMRIPSDDSGQWTEELEQSRKAKHDEWLRAELGAPPYEYPWGSVTSDFDPRGCASDITVSYGDWRLA